MSTTFETEQYAKSGEKPSEEMIDNMERELNDLMSRNINQSTSTPNNNTSSTSSQTSTSSPPSKFKQILEKEKADKKK